MDTTIDKIKDLNQQRDEILRKYEDSWDYVNDTYDPPKEVDELGNEMRSIIIDEQDTLPVDFIIESLTKLGECPSILYDDNGHFAATSDGFQSLPSDDDGETIEIPTDDISMGFYVEKKCWFDTIREALKYYLTE